jgi:septal ring factor EnvC (AmiA/AmiB activator)
MDPANFTWIIGIVSTVASTVIAAGIVAIVKSSQKTAVLIVESQRLSEEIEYLEALQKEQKADTAKELEHLNQELKESRNMYHAMKDTVFAASNKITVIETRLAMIEKELDR